MTHHTTRPTSRRTRRTRLLVALTLLATLPFCTPPMQARQPDGTTRSVRVLLGGEAYLVPRVTVEDFGESTPDTTYVHFPECGGAAAADVRRLGMEQARDLCLDAQARENRSFLGTAGVLIAGLGVAVYLLLHALGLA